MRATLPPYARQTIAANDTAAVAAALGARHAVAPRCPGMDDADQDDVFAALDRVPRHVAR